MEYGLPFEWDGPEKRNMFFRGRTYFMGATGCGDVSDCFNFNGRGASIRVENEGITGRATKCTVGR